MRIPVLIAAVALSLPASAAAAPPPNDNYLASTTINRANGSMASEYSDSVDTTEATTQPDLFDPNRDGLPFGGGDPEPTSCGDGTSFGKTAWWDFRPPSPGGIQIKANGGFDVVVAVYTWSSTTSRITRTVRCQNDAAGSEDLVIPSVRKGTNYTVQVGGAGDTGGPRELRADLVPRPGRRRHLRRAGQVRPAAGDRALRRLPARAALRAADQLQPPGRRHPA